MAVDLDTSRTSSDHVSIEVRSLADEDKDAYVDFFTDSELPEFRPKVGIFGAPQCRCTNAVIALIGSMIGMIFATIGACLLLFFTQENTIIPLGITLIAVGFLMMFFGCILWTSEFMCNDCVGQLYQRVKEAPLKNAIKRREKIMSRMSQNSRSSSRQSQLTQLSYQTNGSVNSRRPILPRY